MRIQKPLKIMLPAYILVLTGFLLAAIYGSRAVTTLSENYVSDNRTCVIIDAGHGGVDGGATSCTGVLESAINLEISIKLNDLSRMLGLKTLMIRSDDRSIYTSGETIAEKKISDLKERVRIVNESENAVLISIHQNYYSDERYSGLQAFYATTEESRGLAELIQTNAKKFLSNDNNRQVKKATGVYLMKHITCPGVLIECGFLSNYQEEALLRSSDYQNKLSAMIAVTMCNYLDR